MQNLIDRLQRIQDFLRDGVYEIIGVEAEEFYKKSFRDEGFTDDSLEKWPDVQRRTRPGRGARGQTLAGRPILTGDSGELGESIHYEKKPPHVVIHADKDYAQVHNEGGKAGRTGRQFHMKKRQFIGKSNRLNRQITDKIKTGLKNI